MNICGISKFIPNAEPCPSVTAWEVAILGKGTYAKYEVCGQHLTSLRYFLLGQGHSITIGRTHNGD